MGPESLITVKTGRGNKITREIKLDDSEKVELSTNKSSNMLLFRSSKATYDLVRSYFQDKCECYKTEKNLTEDGLIINKIISFIVL